MGTVIPENYELIAGVVALSTIAHSIYMPLAVGKARKKYGVKYPDLYANKDNCKDETSIKVFNCTQRGHQNSLELLPTFLALLVLAGLKHPITAAAAGVLYVFGRIAYFWGYATGTPSRRMTGGPMYGAGFMTLLVICIKSVVELVISKLN